MIHRAGCKRLKVWGLAAASGESARHQAGAAVREGHMEDEQSLPGQHIGHRTWK